jgi:AraC-like DNA-binding protein
VGTATTLVQFRAERGCGEKARRLLSLLYGQFTEGSGTRDLKAVSFIAHAAPQARVPRYDLPGARRRRRKALAISFLRNAWLSVDDIAEHVGCSDAANFRVAFKRWTNKATRNIPAVIPVTWN